MTRDDIMRWAVQARLPNNYATGEPMWPDRLERFADLVAAHEREMCAGLCGWRTGVRPVDAAIETCAAAIRARGDTE